MEPLPLIPKNNTLNHDTSHILREAFQEVLGSSILTRELAENLEKRNVKMEPLKICGVTSNTIYSAHEKNEEHIDEIEQKFLERKAEHMIIKDIIDQSDFIKEIIKLKRQAIFRKMDQPSLEKYGLLEYNSLLPNIAERAIDFRLNSNDHICNSPHKSANEGFPAIEKAASCEKKRNIKVANFRSSGNKNNCNLSQKGSTEIHRAEVVFQAIPEILIFYDCKLNIEYKKKIKLKNITNTVQKISFKNSLQSKYFGIFLESVSKIAGGMNAVYYITYKTDVYNDVKETVLFRASSGQELEVQLMSQRNAPLLQTYIVRHDYIETKPEKFLSSPTSYNIDRTIALNCTIDCGFSFVGKEILLTMIIKNEGGHGIFFIMTEEDWFSLNVEDVNVNLELCAGVFHIFPAYFEIACHEFVNINVSFYPKKYGLFVQTIFVLCNNNTFLPLDLIGDGIYFETNMITFDLPKKNGKAYFLDFESEFCLYVGRCLACTKTTASIKVSNNSALNLTYRWNIRKSENLADFKFKHMSSYWITIKPVSCLPSYSTTDFELTVFPEISEGGFYHTVLSLYIENIPEASLLDHETFTVIERPDYSETKLLDVLVGEIEVLCEVEAARVIIEPNPLNIPCLLMCNKLHKQSFSVINCTNFFLQCKWLPHKNNSCTVIEPNEFELGKNSYCTVYILPKEYEDVEETFILDVNDGSYKDIFLVKAKISAPTASLSANAFDFGIILVGVTYRQTIYVENNSSETLSWYLVEDVVDQSSGNIKCFEDPTNIRPNNGQLQEKGKCLVEYEAQNENCGEWSSHIKLFTNFSKTNTPIFVCSVHFVVCTPDIMVHTNTSEMPILCPEDILYVGVPTDHYICLHNGGDVDTVFAFGKPLGKVVNDFEITVLPRLGNICAKENVHIDVKITPLKMGYYEDVLIPCYFLGLDYAFVVKLMCVVGDIMVNIYLPNELGNCNIILWPELKICESCYCSDIGDEQASSIMSAKDEKDYGEVKTFLEKQIFITECENEFSPSPSKTSETSASSDAHNLTTIYHCFDKKLCEENEKSLKSSHSEMDVRVIPLTISPSVSSSSSSTNSSESQCLLPLKEKIKEFFGRDLKIHDHILAFDNVPLKTPVKKIIRIENLTPGHGTVCTEVTNLYCSEQKQDIVRDIMISTNMRKSNEWEDIVTNEGIAIKVQPSEKNLNPFETIEIQIWIYANTWGYYMDELVVDISELTPFYTTLIVEVIGTVIEFPLAVNTICKQPTIRLGIVPFKSGKIQRKIKVNNTSMVPIYISWHCFLKDKDKTKRDFGVIFDMVDPETENYFQSPKEAKLMKENLGVATSTHFEVDPEILLIQPRSQGYVNLTVNVYCFNEDCFYKKINGQIVGSIHLHKQFKIQENSYFRPTGMNTNLVKLKITGKLEIPHLHIDDLPKAIEITAYASDIVENLKFVNTKRLIFKNRRLSEAVIYMVTEDPFEFASVKTLRYEESKFINFVNLKPGECLEVILKCKINDLDVLKLAPRIRLTENVRILSRNIVIYQRNALQVEIPISLVIFYPSFRVSPKEIIFSKVFIGNVAKSILTLKNLTGALIPFQIIKSIKCKELIICPSSGVIQPESTGQKVTISVFFKPNEPITYKASLIIASNIPRYEESVEIIGMGSYDEKFYVPGNH